MRKTKLSIGILAMAFVSLTAMACKNETKKNNAVTDMNNMEMNHASGDNNSNVKTATQKNAATTPIIEAYLKIKNGLVADNEESAAKGGSQLLEAFSNFDMSKLSEEQHKSYMDIVADAKEQAEHIAKSPLEHQREHFVSLSNDMDDLVMLLGTDKTLYQDFCPMADNGKGASWLSETKEIKNPFYGSKMSTCGTIKKEIN